MKKFFSLTFILLLLTVFALPVSAQHSKSILINPSGFKKFKDKNSPKKGKPFKQKGIKQAAEPIGTPLSKSTYKKPKPYVSPSLPID